MTMEVGHHLVRVFVIETVIDQTDLVLHEIDTNSMEIGMLHVEQTFQKSECTILYIIQVAMF